MKRIKIIDIDEIKEKSHRHIASLTFNHEIVVVRIDVLVWSLSYVIIYDRHTLERLYFLQHHITNKLIYEPRIQIACMIALSYCNVHLMVGLPQVLEELSADHAVSMGEMIKDSGMDVTQSSSWEAVYKRWKKSHERVFGSQGVVE